MISSIQEPGRRYAQLERILLVIELLAPLRCGATLKELAADVNDELGTDYHVRTIRRDVEALATLGMIECTEGGIRGRVSARFRWRDRSIRAVVTRHAAVRVTEAENT